MMRLVAYWWEQSPIPLLMPCVRTRRILCRDLEQVLHSNYCSVLSIFACLYIVAPNKCLITTIKCGPKANVVGWLLWKPPWMSDHKISSWCALLPNGHYHVFNVWAFVVLKLKCLLLPLPLIETKSSIETLIWAWIRNSYVGAEQYNFAHVLYTCSRIKIWTWVLIMVSLVPMFLAY